jgi:hypothetical protein
VFVVEIDALVFGVVVVLMQEEHLITFTSNSLGLKQQVMYVYKRKMMVIMHVITK